MTRLALPRALALVIVCAIAASVPVGAQRGRGGGAPPASARSAAPIDITGYWVSPITEDWKYRMVTPKKGVFDALPLNPEGRKVGESWDPARDEAAGEQCRAYGAPAKAGGGAEAACQAATMPGNRLGNARIAATATRRGRRIRLRATDGSCNARTIPEASQPLQAACLSAR